MTLTGIALRNLINRPWRSLLTLAGVVLAIAAYVALVGLARGIEETLLSSLEDRGTDILISESGVSDPLASAVPVSLAVEVAKVPGVADVAPELARLTTLSDGGANFVVGWPETGFGWNTQTLTRGRYPQADDGGGVVVGESLAKRMGKDLGDTIELFSVPFTIVGIIDSPSLLNRNMVIGLLSDIQAQTYRSGQATAIAVRVGNGASPEQRAAVLAALQARFPALSIEATDKLVTGYTNIRIARILAWSVSLVAVISAALAVMNTMAMAVNERRGEIAIMGAVGWPPGRIVACLVIEGAVLSLAGGVGGAALGAAVALGVALSPAVTGFVEPMLSPALLTRAVGLALVIGLLGSVLPAWRSTTRNPAAILRGH